MDILLHAAVQCCTFAAAAAICECGVGGGALIEVKFKLYLSFSLVPTYKPNAMCAIVFFAVFFRNRIRFLHLSTLLLLLPPPTMVDTLKCHAIAAYSVC